MIARFLFIALACTSCGTDWTSSTSPNSTGADAAPAPVTRCTSNTYWTFGNEGSSRMHPGDTCVGCHAQAGGEAPLLTAAGTVYPTLHEPTDCNGIAGGASVVITDANLATYTLTVNSAGNFYTSAPLAFPITAKVVANGHESAMAAAQPIADCNGCHTADGTNGAPGRIAVP